MLDEHRDLRPSVREVDCPKQRYLVSVAGFRDTVDLSLIFNHVWVRHMDGEIDCDHGLWREAFIGVFEGADVPFAGMVCEVFAEDMDGPVAYDPEWVGKKSLTVAK